FDFAICAYYLILSVSVIDQTRKNRPKPPFSRKKWHRSKNKVTLLRKSDLCPITLYLLKAR
ncbi:MAG: hypothetical protein II297_03450, partial [Clostridia bacterium]|nr:hypothetical protein [Clostridia bacterium]